jgi:imidazolonepropionase-like amidohydrolase
LCRARRTPFSLVLFGCGFAALGYSVKTGLQSDAGRIIKHFVFVYLSASISLWCCSLRAQQKAEADNRLALTGARIYPAPGAEPIANGVVVVADGRIASVGDASRVRIPSGTRIFDCTGKSLVAGLWNTRVHFIEPKWNNAANLSAEQLTRQLQEMLTRHGFTSVVDTGSPLENTLALRRRVTNGEVVGPRILTAGMILFPRNGLPYYVTESLAPEVVKQFAEGEAATPEDAVRIVDKQIADGADIVKLYLVSWLRRANKIAPLAMPLSVVKAAVQEAHRKGKLVFAHPSTMEGVELALAGQVDVLAHTVEEAKSWNRALAARLHAAHVTLIPTLTLFSHKHDFALILKQVTTYHEIGGQIMFGTDVGYLTDYAALNKEYDYMARAGQTFPDVLAALTTNPAARLGYADHSGQVKPGMDADVVLLEGDPSQDMNALARVALVIRQGQIIYRATIP